MSNIEITFRTGKIVIETAKCAACKTHPCINACQVYGANLFTLTDGKFALINSLEETGRRCIEDLSCEIYCQRNGNKGLVLNLDMFGLEEYRKKIGIK
jgi:ferredoxin-like protein FixX